MFPGGHQNDDELISREKGRLNLVTLYLLKPQPIYKKITAQTKYGLGLVSLFLNIDLYLYKNFLTS